MNTNTLIPTGKIFEKNGHKFILLEHFDNGTTTVITADSIKQMAFGAKNNDWTKSDIRADLNSYYLKELEETFGAENIVEHKVDLISLDGLDDYGKTTDKVSLLTHHQYQKYRKVLGKNLDQWWWLATPDSTPSGWSSNFVCCVRSNGNAIFFLYYNRDNGGVRPFLTLKSTIFES
ncbi:MAG: DUF6273 domain-containing protein [Bacteroidales bacterium]|nr:DUF6273 domain-containing protein [Bacteroidales bacterium]